MHVFSRSLRQRIFLSGLAGLLIFLSTTVAREVPLAERLILSPAPRVVQYEKQTHPFPREIAVSGLNPADPAHETTLETFRNLQGILTATTVVFRQTGEYPIVFSQSDAIAHREGYRLDASGSGMRITYRTAAGMFYGAQTAYQILAHADAGHRFLYFDERPAEPEKSLPVVSIEDSPAYATRSFLIDLGRAPFSPALLKRVVRIAAHLKINALHVRLYDDELGGFRFSQLPLGRENPFALDADDLKELVRYARRYHMAIIPELESWAHVQSITDHFPELRGTDGMWGGASFGIGERTYALLEKIYDEVVPCLEDTAAVHVGLDEAVWAVLPGEENRGHTPENMVGRIHEILMRVARHHGKKITMHLWADHGGRPIPVAIRDQVVVEPWGYHETMKEEIFEKLRTFGGAGKTPVMMGAGVSWTRVNGDYEASRLWAQEGLKYPNVVGITLCLWGTNDVGGRLMTLFGGAGVAWSPHSFVRAANDPLGESLRNAKDREMRKWQAIFPDADRQVIDLDRGPEIVVGRYVNRPYAGYPVAPTAEPPAFGRQP